MKHTTVRRISAALTSLLLLTFVLVLPVSADMGPKPQITITVINPPEGEYYLDLLEQHDPGDTLYSNLNDEELTALPEAVRTTLHGYHDSGWQAALTVGTRIPLFGNLTGKPQADGTVLHTFSYHGTPNEYRIIIVMPDGSYTVSDTLVRKAFRQTVTYDFAAGTAVNETSVPLAYLTHFAVTCSSTLLLEGVLLWAFGFFSRRNLLPFFGINLVTQIALTAITGTTLIFSGSFGAYIMFILCEIGIFLAEAIACAFLLDGHGRGRRVLYSLTANLVSATMGWMLIGALFGIIF
ncbi:MAG: hypothetical protein IKD37_01830 [Clostridia bacterium]|nr:hypothetical protein [Clostridia bacterium]